MLLQIIFILLPLVFLFFACWFFLTNEITLPRWRKRIFTAALVLDGVSVGVLLFFFVHVFVFTRDDGQRRVLERAYPVGTMMLFAIISAWLAPLGRKDSSKLLLCGGVMTLLVWILAAFGVSD